MTRLIVALWLGWALSACSNGTPTPRPKPAPVCRLRRAAFDIGSATTKVKVADIDICTHRIVHVLFVDEAPVFYRDDLIDRPEHAEFKSETLERGMAVLAGFKQRAAAFEPSGYAAVATQSFRKAENGEAFLERVHRELGIIAHLISQAEEGELGFIGAAIALGVDQNDAVVWDIGGGSMEISMFEGTELRIYTGKLASGQMRQYIIHEIQHRDAESPNPISAEEAPVARSYAAEFAKRDVPPPFQRKIAAAKSVVIGIGALKYFPDEGANKSALSLAGIEKGVATLLGKSDADIGGPYASTLVSDRLLIAGFMEGLGIARVVLADVNLADGLLFHEDYWE